MSDRSFSSEEDTPKRDRRGDEPHEAASKGPVNKFLAVLSFLLFAGGIAVGVFGISGLGSTEGDWVMDEDYGATPDLHPTYIGGNKAFEPNYATFLVGLGASLLTMSTVVFYSMRVLQWSRGDALMVEIADNIQEGATRFLHTEYIYVGVFVVIIFVLIGTALEEWNMAANFAVGAVLSALSGYIGMHMAVRGNVRTCEAARQDLGTALQVAFRTGATMGLSVVGLGLFGLCLMYIITNEVRSLGGFGAGSSAVALFARVGGGIYTKAADVGADLVGKVEADIPEDDPRNPATIADNVGDNVGDVAGMGADLFESYVGSIIAASLIGVDEITEREYRAAGMYIPFWIAIIGCMAGIFFTMYVKPSGTMEGLLASLRYNVFGAAALVVGMVAIVLWRHFPDGDTVATVVCYDIELAAGVADTITNNYCGNFEMRSFTNDEFALRLYFSIIIGLGVGILIGSITEYFTSHSFRPTQMISESSEFGAGPVIITGLGMGMYSCLLPLLLVTTAVVVSYELAGFFGTSLASVGMLSTLGVTMATDAYGPVADNAGGIAEMAELPPYVRESTDLLDALGNTTAATGKGFANGSAVLSALSLLVAFTREAKIDMQSLSIMNHFVLAGILVGALLPYVFGAMTMLAVSKSAQHMIAEVRRQFREIPGLREGTGKADHAKCVEISTKGSLREMILPGLLAVASPLVFGLFFGLRGLAGLLVGAISSGYLLGVMMSNAGGAWDNAKKYVEAGHLKNANGDVMAKGTDWHKAAVSGDTVGDPFKDTSGPALNILIKLMTRFSFVFAGSIFDLDPQDNYWVGFIILGAFMVVIALMLMYFAKSDAEIMAQLRAPAPGASREMKRLDSGDVSGSSI